MPLPEIAKFVFSKINENFPLQKIHLELEKNYGIYAKQHKTFANLWQYTYDQIESNSTKFHPLVRSSRGIILDVEGKQIVAYPFDRFFNYGEDPNCNFDFSAMRVQEKLDGSLIIFYWYNGWQVATKGSPDASGSVGDNPFTFAELAWKVMKSQHPNYETLLNKRFTYMFELCSKYNQIVTNQSDNEGTLTLIGIRCKETWNEISVRDFIPTGWKVVQEFLLSTIDEVLEASKKLNASQTEGFVLVDENFNRIKVKSPLYVMAHHLLGDVITEEKILKIVLSGEQSEIVTYLPHKKEIFDKVEEKLNTVIRLAESYWNHPELQQMIRSGATTRKEIALWTQRTVPPALSFIVYSMLDKKYQTVQDAIRAQAAKKILDLFYKIMR